MMVLWEEGQTTLKHLGNRIFLDSGTLTPMLRKLETKGFIERFKDPNDDRNLILKVTDKGYELREKALLIPSKIVSCVHLEKDEAITLYTLLHKVLSSLDEIK